MSAQTSSQTQPQQQPASPRQGVFARLRTLLAGSRDPVDQQLAEIERQGATLSRLAHAAAAALIVLFSIGSLLGLSHDALIVLQHQWQTSHTVDLPSALAAAVNAILVLVMDTALLLAASMLRIIKARQQGEGAGVHVLVMIGVSLIEGATWAYFSWLYDAPHDPVAWSLIGARAVAAPLLSAYLSLARPIPIGPRDILYQAAMASGKGVIRDVTREANDQSAPLDRKIAIYGAAELMHPTDRARLEKMIAAVQQHTPTSSPTPTPSANVDAHPPLPQPSLSPSPSPSPSELFAVPRDHLSAGAEIPSHPTWGSNPASPGTMRHEDPSRDHRVFALNLLSPHARPQPGQTARPAPTREEIARRRMRAARRILATTPDIGLRELTRQIAIATHYHISESTVAKIAAQLRAETQPQSRPRLRTNTRDPDPAGDSDPDPAA